MACMSVHVATTSTITVPPCQDIVTNVIYNVTGNLPTCRSQRASCNCTTIIMYNSQRKIVCITYLKKYIPAHSLQKQQHNYLLFPLFLKKKQCYIIKKLCKLIFYIFLVFFSFFEKTTYCCCTRRLSVRPSVSIISFRGISISNKPIDLRMSMNVRKGVVHVRKA